MAEVGASFCTRAAVSTNSEASGVEKNSVFTICLNPQSLHARKLHAERSSLFVLVLQQISLEQQVAGFTLEL